MTFSERVGIEPELFTDPPITEDAPEPFRKGAIKASVDALGWDALRQLATDAIRGKPPSDMIRWYQDWDESDDALLYCPWPMFYDIIEAVSIRKHESIPVIDSIEGMIFSAFFVGPTLEDMRKATREFHEYVQRINTLFRIHNIAYSLRNNEIVSADLYEVQ